MFSLRLSWFWVLLLACASCTEPTAMIDTPIIAASPIIFPASGKRSTILPDSGKWLNTISSDSTKRSAVIDTARHYIYVRELTGKNDGKEVEMFQKYAHIRKGDPWCAAFVTYCLTVCAVNEPAIRTGLARNFMTKKSIPARQVLEGRAKVPNATIIIWAHGNGISGHAGLNERQTAKNAFWTIQGNTGAGSGSKKWEGDGVYEKNASIQPGSNFRIIGFTVVK